MHFEDTPEIVLFLSDGDTTEENPMVSEEDRRNQAVETEVSQEPLLLQPCLFLWVCS